MGMAKEILAERMSKESTPVRRQYTINIREDLMDSMDVIARVLTSQSKKNVTRNSVIEDALEAFSKEALELFGERHINMEAFTQQDDTIPAEYDTVILPTTEEGFLEVFLEENRWYYARLKKEKTKKIRYLALYIKAPVGQITHYVAVKQNGFEQAENGKYIIHFEGNPVPLNHPVPLGTASPASVRSPRYTTLEKLLTAVDVDGLK